MKEVIFAINNALMGKTTQIITLDAEKVGRICNRIIECCCATDIDYTAHITENVIVISGCRIYVSSVEEQLDKHRGKIIDDLGLCWIDEGDLPKDLHDLLYSRLAYKKEEG